MGAARLKYDPVAKTVDGIPLRDFARWHANPLQAIVASRGNGKFPEDSAMLIPEDEKRLRGPGPYEEAAERHRRVMGEKIMAAALADAMEAAGVKDDHAIDLRKATTIPGAFIATSVVPDGMKLDMPSLLAACDRLEAEKKRLDAAEIAAFNFACPMCGQRPRRIGPGRWALCQDILTEITRRFSKVYGAWKGAGSETGFLETSIGGFVFELIEPGPFDAFEPFFPDPVGLAEFLGIAPVQQQLGAWRTSLYRRDMAAAEARAAETTLSDMIAGRCTCGQPDTPGVLHRRDGPCYRQDNGYGDSPSTTIDDKTPPESPA